MDGAETRQPIVEMAVSQAATTVLTQHLLILWQHLHPVLPALEAMAGAAKILVEQLAMPRDLMVAAAPPTVIVEPLTVIVSLQMDARMAAQTTLLLARRLVLPPLLSLDHLRQQPRASPFLVSPRVPQARSQLAFPPLMAAVVPSLVIQSAATGPRDPAAPCTATVVTPQPIAVRDAKVVLATRHLASPHPPQAQRLLL